MYLAAHIRHPLLPEESEFVDFSKIPNPSGIPLDVPPIREIYTYRSPTSFRYFAPLASSSSAKVISNNPFTWHPALVLPLVFSCYQSHAWCHNSVLGVRKTHA